MKHVRKLAACALALVMALAMSAVALAATVENATSHSYNAYQVFSGTQETNGVPLGDAEWGTGVDGAALLAELQADARFNVGTDSANIFAGCTTALDVATVLGGYSDASDVAKAFANDAAKHLTTVSTPIAAGATTVELATGYYLLVDTGTVEGNDAYNSALLQVTNKENVKIDKKYDVPTVDKSVKDTDGQWGESADWEIGSDVPFQLVGTLPTNLADFETYTYVFHDTLSAGLQYNGDAKVYVLNGEGDAVTKTEVTASFSIATGDAATQGDTLTISCADLKAVSGVTASSKIVVEYTAELLPGAVIGSTGNSNTVKLEYSNNPNQTGQGTPTTSNTPEDEVLVFTYELDVTKVDGKDATKTLANAEFVLLNSDKSMVATVANGVFAGWVAVPAADTDGKIAWPAGTVLTSSSAEDGHGTFSVKGLDAGSYYLRETKAPAGYNLLKSDISVAIAATLDKTENSPALTALTIQVKEDKEGATATESNGVLATGVVSTNVQNNAGAQLPETGGMGTTLFYVVGGILVVGAAVLLVVRRRMNSSK